MNPLICISADSDPRRRAGGSRQLLSPKAYAAAIAAAGGIPLIAAEYAPEALAALCDGLLLSGGDDLDPALYGEEILNSSVSPDPERDAFEYTLAQAFLTRGKPVFGICRGCQVLNCLLGGTLYQDLPTQLGVQHLDSALRHPVICQEDSLLARLFGTRFSVNSTHHQAVRTIAPGLRITALSHDGVVEAFESTGDAFVLGVQFHPERLTGPLWDDRTPDLAPLFKAFVRAAHND